MSYTQIIQEKSSIEDTLNALTVCVYIVSPERGNYEENYYYFKEEKRLRKRVLKLVKLLRKKIKLLDCGCGEGSFIKKALKNGFDVYGDEISKITIAKK